MKVATGGEDRVAGIVHVAVAEVKTSGASCPRDERGFFPLPLPRGRSAGRTAASRGRAGAPGAGPPRRAAPPRGLRGVGRGAAEGGGVSPPPATAAQDEG